MAKSLYEVLGVDKNATEQQIAKAYKKLAIKYHPDKQVGKSDAEKQKAEAAFKEVAAAYEVLSDKEKRQQYDMFGTVNGAPNMNNGGYTNPFGGFGFDFADLFGGGRRSGASGRQYAPGADVRMRIPLTIEEVFNGCKKTVKYKKNVRCSHCHGAGGSGKKSCPKCGGTGQIMDVRQTPFGIAQQITTCPDCRGEGYIVESRCKHCGGTGFETKEASVTVEFPAGIQDTNGLQIPGMGHEAKDSLGNNGNFIAIANYKFTQDEFEIAGYNVRHTVNIPYYDLILGCEYSLKKPDGSVRKINIASCTPNGKQIRLYKDGIAGKGDYYITLNAQFPESLSPADQVALEQVRRNHQD